MSDQKDQKGKREYSVDEILAEYGSGRSAGTKVVDFPERRDKPARDHPEEPTLLRQLKEEGVWVFGAAMDGTTPLYKADLKGPAAIVIGSEGSGLGRLVAESCDFAVSIPMFGKINSLNASAAAAVLLYEAVRQRMGG